MHTLFGRTGYGELAASCSAMMPMYLIDEHVSLVEIAWRDVESYSHRSYLDSEGAAGGRGNTTACESMPPENPPM
jgi:hypothetical protein